jgi:hypothetical protein
MDAQIAELKFKYKTFQQTPRSVTVHTIPYSHLMIKAHEMSPDKSQQEFISMPILSTLFLKMIKEGF